MEVSIWSSRLNTEGPPHQYRWAHPLHQEPQEERGRGGQAPSASDGTPTGPSGVHTPHAFKLRLNSQPSWVSSSQMADMGTSHGHRWRRRWHPTPVLLPGKPHGWRPLCASPYVHPSKVKCSFPQLLGVLMTDHLQLSSPGNLT